MWRRCLFTVAPPTLTATHCQQTVAGAVFALLLNMSTHAPLLERLAASVPVPWVLLAATALADERGTPRENLFGLACNLATNAKFAAGLVQHPGLWDILKLHLTNKVWGGGWGGVGVLLKHSNDRLKRSPRRPWVRVWWRRCVQPEPRRVNKPWTLACWRC